MRKEKLWHLLRLLLIAALLISAVLLARETGYYSRAFDRLSGTAAETEKSEETLPELSAAELADSIRPRTVLVRMGDGAAAASAYAGEETEEAFHRFSAILGEALGSAGAPDAIDETAFRAGLDAECLFMDFFCEAPLGVLAQWLGSEMHSEAAWMSAQVLYLGLSDVTVQLCYRSGDGGFYRCTTAAMTETLRARMSEFQGGEAQFAYADASLRAMDPYTVLLSAMPEVRSVSGTPVYSGIDTAELMQTLEMNSYLASSYLETDGTHVFIDNEKTLRISPDGTVTFHTDAADGERRIADGVSAAVGRAYETAVRSIGRYAGDANVLLTGISENSTGGYSIRFDYCIDCIPLRLPSGSAAQIVIRNGQLEELHLAFRSYVRTEETENVLPMRQAAAVADAAGATPALVYADSGDAVRCVWVKD